MKRDGRIHEQHSIPSKQRPRWLGDGMESIQIREYILNLIPLETEYFVEKNDVETCEFFVGNFHSSPFNQSKRRTIV